MNKILSAIRYPLSAISILFVLFSASTPATAGTFEIINTEGCKAFFPDSMSPKNWSGQCKDGLAEGTVTFGDFKGKAQFSSGYVNGLISFTRKDGFSYKCNYKDSLPYGSCSQKQGKYLNYTSRFEDGQELEGYGKKPFAVDADPDKSSLEGEFYNGQLHGFGKFTISKSISTYALEKKSNGQFADKGKYLIAQGIWENGTLVKSCPSKKACQTSESRESNQSQQSIYNEGDTVYIILKGGKYYAVATVEKIAGQKAKVFIDNHCSAYGCTYPYEFEYEKDKTYWVYKSDLMKTRPF